MSDQKELELAFKSVLVEESAPENFALSIMAKLGNPSTKTSHTAKFAKDAAHFSWIVVPKQEQTRPMSIWRRLSSWASRKQNATLELGLFASQKQDRENAFWQPLLSVTAHGAIFAVVLLVFANRGPRILSSGLQNQENFQEVEISSPNLPIGKQPLSGGGGGGAHQPQPPTTGKPPLAQKIPIPVTTLKRQDDPKLAVEPSVVLPQMIASTPPDLGMPQQVAVHSGSMGSGSDGGIGTGVGGGIGGGKGNGVGPGIGGGLGGGVYRVGGGVTAPVAIYSVDPEYTDEARRIKFSGLCTVSVVVTEEGLPTNIHVVRPVGLGLDEKAVEAVKQYRFRPGRYQGKPVAVQMYVIINFRIY